MKIKLVYFSEFVSDISFYSKEKMDFFVFLLMSIIDDSKINKEDSIANILSDLQIPPEMFYLFNNVYYHLIDNNLLKGEEKNFDILLKKEIKLTYLGKTYFDLKYLPKFLYSIEKAVIYNPLLGKLEAKNEYIDQDDIVVMNELYSTEDIRNLINDSKNSLFPDIEEDVFLEPEVNQINPVLIELDLIKKAGGYHLIDLKDKEHLIKQIVENSILLNNINFTNANDEDCLLLTNNTFYDFLVGSDEVLKLRSDFYFIINDEEKFTFDGNIIFLPNEVREIFEDKNIFGFKGDFSSIGYKEINFEKNHKLGLISNKKERSKGKAFKKYLSDNKSKFESEKIIDFVIELL